MEENYYGPLSFHTISSSSTFAKYVDNLFIRDMMSYVRSINYVVGKIYSVLGLKLGDRCVNISFLPEDIPCYLSQHTILIHRDKRA